MALSRHTGNLPTTHLWPALFDDDDWFGGFRDVGRRMDQRLQPYKGLGSVDIRDTAEALDFIIDVPGLEKDDVKVQVKDGVLSIHGERKDEKEEKTDTSYYRERSFGKFSRHFNLPPNIDPASVAADVKKGVMTIHVPKVEDTGYTVNVNHQ
jgi:HSP20 family protein